MYCHLMATFELILVARHLLPSIGVFINFNEALCAVVLANGFRVPQPDGGGSKLHLDGAAICPHGVMSNKTGILILTPIRYGLRNEN